MKKFYSVFGAALALTLILSGVTMFGGTNVKAACAKKTTICTKKVTCKKAKCKKTACIKGKCSAVKGCNLAQIINQCKNGSCTVVSPCTSGNCTTTTNCITNNCSNAANCISNNTCGSTTCNK